MTMHSLLFTRVRLKALSLLFAAVLWLFVMLESGDEQEFAVVLRPVNTSRGLSAVPDSSQLKVRLGGARILLFRQKLLGVNAEVDLLDRGAGGFTLKSSEVHLQVVPGLKVLSLSPVNLEIIISSQK